MEGTELTVLETVQESDVELTKLVKEKTALMRVLELPERLLKKERAALKAEQLPIL